MRAAFDRRPATGRRRPALGAATRSPTTPRFLPLYEQALSTGEPFNAELRVRSLPTGRHGVARRQRRHGRPRRRRRRRERHHRRGRGPRGAGARARALREPDRAFERSRVRRRHRPARSSTRPRGAPSSSATRATSSAPPLSRVAPGDRDEAAAWFDEVRALPSGTRGAVGRRCGSSRATARSTRATSPPRTGRTSRRSAASCSNAHDVSALVAAEARLAAVADAIADVIAICDENADIMWVSGAVRDHARHRARGARRALGVRHHASRRPRRRRRRASLGFVDDPTDARADRHPAAARRRHATAGSRRSGNNQLDDPSIRGLVVSLRDITERRAAGGARCGCRRSGTAASSRPRPTRSSRSTRNGDHPELQPGRRAHLRDAAPTTRSARTTPVPARGLARRSSASALEHGRVGEQIDTIATRGSGERFAAQVAVSDVQVGETHYYTAVRARHQRPARDGTGAAGRGDVRRAHRPPEPAHAARPHAATRSTAPAAPTTSSAWCSSTSTASSS